MRFSRAIKPAAGVLVALLALSGCVVAAPSEEAAPRPIASGEPEPDPTPAGPELNEHGFVAKAIGEPAGVVFPGTETPAFEITVTGVQRQFVCTGTYSSPPENGEFVALSIEVRTSPDYFTLAGNGLQYYWQDFFTYSSPTSEGVESPPTWVGCVNEEEEIPRSTPAGEVFTGYLFLDAPADATSFSWTPGEVSLQGVPGWEWPL